jgi:hypothetical protein
MIVCPRENMFPSTSCFYEPAFRRNRIEETGTRVIPLLSRSQYLSYRGTPHGEPVPQAKFGRNRCYGVGYSPVLEWLYAEFGLVIGFI